jgi:hypothetical protein
MTCRIGPEPCRTRLDFEPLDTDGEAETDDDVEGTWPLHTSPAVTKTCGTVGAAAVSRNANGRV